jgi:hypothetical protein
MEDRPYAVVVDKGLTRFVLPVRSRTIFQKIGGACMLAGTVLIPVGACLLIWALNRNGLSPRAVIWGTIGGVVGCGAALKYGWAAFQGAQAEICICPESDYLRSTHIRGAHADWVTVPLSKLDSLRVVDVSEAFGPKDNVAVWARRTDNRTDVLVRDYPKWVVEMLVADIEQIMTEAKARQEGALHE